MIDPKDTSNPTRVDHFITSLARLMDDRTLKHNDSFAVFDQHGNINLAFDEQGIFHHDTRHLSRLVVRLNGVTPVLLGSAVRDDNAMLIADMANADFPADAASGDTDDHGKVVRFGTLHLHRNIFLCGDCCYECMTIANYGSEAVDTELSFEFKADFKDIFEVRGEKRDRSGTHHAPQVQTGRVELSYTGLDGVDRSTTLSWSPAPDELDASRAGFALHIPADQTINLRFTLEMSRGRQPVERLAHNDAQAQTLRRLTCMREDACRVVSSNEQFNAWLDRSLADVNMMTSDVGSGLRYPFAGVPWYSTVFGRDGLIVAHQMLWCNPRIARGVLLFLASRQATAIDRQRDAEPGKIVHELRQCEMAATGEVPFREYFGTVDATPLFVMLAGRYYQTTNDLETIGKIWPNIQQALQWIEEYGDRSGDGFVDYECQSSDGLANQGWKDSYDSVMHADGELAEGPVALVEVQGYVYSARRKAAILAKALGDDAFAGEMQEKAATLKSRFEEAFWCEQLQQYALALDGGNRRCAVRASNPGHCLYTGIVPEHRAAAVADALMAEDMFSGWGVRTLSTTAARYNPASYHNGSIWPHDNSIIAAGMARYGFTSYALQIMMAQFEVSTWQERSRLPELFCGFDRADKSGPVGYPVACSPQAWASAGAFLMLGAALGLFVDAPNQAVRLSRPALPESVDQLRIERLSVGEAEIDLLLRRRDDTVDVAVTRQQGDVQVIVSR